VDMEGVGDSEPTRLLDKALGEGVGIGGWGNWKDLSVKVRLKESGLGTGLWLGLGVTGGCGAGRGADSSAGCCSEISFALWTRVVLATRMSEIETLTCLRLAFKPSV
jgi:hypothetical protein